MDNELKRKEIEELESLPQDDQIDIVKEVIRNENLEVKLSEGHIVEEIRSPYPPINFLKEIENIDSPIALGIIEDSRKAVQTSTEIAKNESKANIRLKYLGSIGGFIIALIGIGGGIYLGSKGQDPSAIGSMLIGVGSVISSLRFIKKTE